MCVCACDWVLFAKNVGPPLWASQVGCVVPSQQNRCCSACLPPSKTPPPVPERTDFAAAGLHPRPQGGKFDLAQDLCQKCLKYNKSCAKVTAFEGGREVNGRESKGVPPLGCMLTPGRGRVGLRRCFDPPASNCLSYTVTKRGRKAEFCPTRPAQAGM